MDWHPERPQFKPLRLVLSWAISAASLGVAAAILPGVDIAGAGGALAVAAVVAVLNATLPPILAALRLPFMLALGFLLVLLLNAFVLKLASDVLENTFTVDNFGWALLAALIVAAVSVVLEVIFGTNDDDTYSLRVVQRIARRQGGGETTEVPGIIYLEIDGLALPVLRRAMRDGNAGTMARWIAEGTHQLTEWETDLSSQTGASQAGILLGSNEDIPAFRWVDKETGLLTACSAPADCARIEAERATGIGLLIDGGSSRGNLLSGEAEEVILTVSRMDAEKKANPGYRAFFANGFNVTRALVLFGWEVILEWTASLRAIRRDVRPRGHRGGIYPFIRGAMCVIVRDLIVYGVLTDMMRGRPAVYATFSGYDEVAHHSGLERVDTLEALRKLDEQFGRIDRARRYAPRPYRIVVLSDHGQTQGATFKQRNGYGLDELVERSLHHGTVEKIAGGDEQGSMVGLAVGEATGRPNEQQGKRAKNDVSDRDVVVLGSGNLGLVSLMEEKHRLTLEEIDERHPELIPALRRPPARRLAPRPLGRARPRRPRRDGRALPPRGGGRGRRSAGVVLRERAAAPAAHGRVCARRRHHGRQLLRPAPRGGLRVRGADLVPRRPRRAPDTAVHPPSRRPTGARRADHRGGGGARGAVRLATAAAGQRADGSRRRSMNLVWAALIVVAATSVTITAMLLVRRRAPEGSRFQDGDRASGVFGVLATGFSVLLGLVVFLAFESYDQSREGAEQEALVLVQQVQTAQFFAPAVTAELTGELVCYGRSIVYDEWPRAETGTLGDTINPWGVELFRTIDAVQPQTTSEEAAFGKWLDQTSDREAARNDRVHGAVGIIPGPLWVVLFVIAGTIFVFMLFFADSGEGAATQGVLMGSVTVVIVLLLILINFLDNPFHSDVGGVRPVAMERSLTLIEEALQAIDENVELPCDAEGNPV